MVYCKIEKPDSLKALIENMKFFDPEYAVCYWIPHKGDDFSQNNIYICQYL
jgi:hypothetical protein